MQQYIQHLDLYSCYHILQSLSYALLSNYQLLKSIIYYIVITLINILFCTSSLYQWKVCTSKQSPFLFLRCMCYKPRPSEV